MKKLSYLFLLSLLFAYCDKDDVPKTTEEVVDSIKNILKDKDTTAAEGTVDLIKNAAILEKAQQSTYQRETDGAPARPTWNDSFRHYPQGDFFQKGRYVLTWTKEPGDRAVHTADRFELYQITFKDPAAMAKADKWGKTLSANDIEAVTLIYTDEKPFLQTETGLVKPIPADVLPPDGSYAPSSSTEYPQFVFNLVKDAQFSWYAVKPGNKNYAGKQAVVAYKVRALRKVTDYNDKGEEIEKEMYNDGTTVIVDYKKGLFAQITGNSTSPATDAAGGVTNSSLVPDKLTTMAGVRAELSFSENQNFAREWEDRKLTGTSPLEELITKEDFETLFPQRANKAFAHDIDGTYYTWENLVEASRYFPKFLNEGTKEDKYRELAALLGNKSHETGDGWAALGEKRWNYGLSYIVELSALGGKIKTQDDLYKAFVSGYIAAGHADYPPVEGKSYHGRGPVQLSWNYNYGAMSEVLFGNKSILLENPNLIARIGLLGWASAIWFWMEPQGNKPSGHDVMVGNVDLTPDSYTPPTSRDNRTVRTHSSQSKGTYADGKPISYTDKPVPAGAEVGFGMTINIINGGLESNTGTIDNRHARRIGYFARYLDYFGTVKKGRDDGKTEPISPKVSGNGDPIPTAAIEVLKNWRNWHYLPADGKSPDDDTKNFPTKDIPSVLSSVWSASF